MSQYGWRLGAVGAGALALLVAEPLGWAAAYAICAAFVLPAAFVGFWLGEPARPREPASPPGLAAAWAAVAGPLGEFFRRTGALLVLLFLLLPQIGDTMAHLQFRHNGSTSCRVSVLK